MEHLRGNKREGKYQVSLRNFPVMFFKMENYFVFRNDLIILTKIALGPPIY